VSGEPSPRIGRFAGEPPSPWEERYRFSRRVEAGPFVLVGGTTSVNDLGFVVGTTPYEQAAEVLRKLGEELARAGLGWASVLQTRVYVTDISRADEVGRAHADVFGAPGAGCPLMTMIEVAALIDPRMLVEIELVAYRGEPGPD
jgi:enamine deaminase RidA (YjgF/YER057c/UK114 family)